MCVILYLKNVNQSELVFQFAHIEGFDDLGNHSMKTSIADQALFFMLYGLHTKWKQPVAYFLIHGSAKGEMLVNFSMEVLDATIQDQTFLPPCVTWLPTMPRP